MKVTEVSDQDMKLCGDVMNLWRAAEHTVKGGSIRSVFDAMVWMQELAKSMLQSRAEESAAASDVAAALAGPSNMKITKAKK